MYYIKICVVFQLKTVTSISGDSIAGLHGAIGGMLPGGVSLSDLLSGKVSALECESKR